jgi:hypothetical protein
MIRLNEQLRLVPQRIVPVQRWRLLAIPRDHRQNFSHETLFQNLEWIKLVFTIIRMDSFQRN